MGRFFVMSGAVKDGCVTLTGEDAAHIALSLRMKPGEALTLCDSASNEYSCVIEAASKNAVVARIISVVSCASELPVRVHLFMSLPKGDKFEFIIQKAVELGAVSVTPVRSSRCVSRPDEKSLEKKLIRWNSIAKEAAKQCGRGIIPSVAPALDFDRALSSVPDGTLKLFCYEGGGTASLKKTLSEAGVIHDAAIFVGPEGGYSYGEAEAAANAGFTPVNLGKRILRCETAPLFALSCFVYQYEL